MTHWRPLLALGAACGLACTKPNPAFDDGAAAQTGGATALASTGTGADDGPHPTSGTTAASATGTLGASASEATSTGPDLDTTTTTDATTTTAATDTTGPACDKIGESCVDGSCCGCGVCSGGTCVPDDVVCGECQTCGMGAACVPATPGTPCTPPGPDPCSTKIWGYAEGTCFAYAPAAGTCEPGAVCTLAQCEAQGAEIAKCDVVCVKDPGKCEAGQLVADLQLDNFCVLDGQTDLCKPHCESNINGDLVYDDACKAGICTTAQSTSCVNYKCDDQLEACASECQDASDCLMFKACVNDKCV